MKKNRSKQIIKNTAPSREELEFVRDPESGKSDFVRSLDELTPEMLPQSIKKKGRRMQKLIGASITAVCLCVLLLSLATILKSALGYAKGRDAYGELADFFKSTDTLPPDNLTVLSNTVPASPRLLPSKLLYDAIADQTADPGREFNDITIDVPANGDELFIISQKLEWLKQVNPDIYGWISIDGTEVDYPIVRGEDNNYYLNHSYSGEYLIVGSIFADYRTSDYILANFNTVLYGHNMKDGSMFNFVEKLTEDEELFDKLRIIIYTADGIYTFAPFSVYETNSRDQYFRMRFANTEEFTDFADSVLKKSMYPRIAEFTKSDRILTLSTCTNEEFSGRYALHARLIDVTEAKDREG